MNRLIRTLLTVMLSLIVLFPLIYGLSASFFSPIDFTDTYAHMLPSDPSFRNYGLALSHRHFLRYVMNSTITSALTAALRIAVSLPAAFALTHFTFRGRMALFIMLLSTLFIPSDAILYENYATIASLRLLDTYAALGRRIQITELTIPAYAYTQEDEEIQAEILRNIYSIWFSHPAMEAIIYWNLVDGFAAFAPQGDMTAGENYFHGGLLRYDFTPKPAYHVIRDLFGKTWRTRLELDSQEASRLSFKGFFGEYELEITANGKTVKRMIHLDRERSANFKLVL